MKRYEIAAIEAVVWLALQAGRDAARRFTQSDIAAAIGVPKRYAEPVLQALARSGILIGTTGPAGGYRFSGREGVTVLEILSAICETGDARPGRATRALIEGVNDIYKSTRVEDLVVKYLIESTMPLA